MIHHILSVEEITVVASTSLVIELDPASMASSDPFAVKLAWTLLKLLKGLEELPRHEVSQVQTRMAAMIDAWRSMGLTASLEVEGQRGVLALKRDPSLKPYLFRASALANAPRRSGNLAT